MERIKGLDSLRFVMAFIVLLGHGTLPFVNLGFLGASVNQVINAFLSNSAVGVAAVMAFFILSGFVIHYPFSTGKKIEIFSFYTKRLLRISLPAIVALILYSYFFDYKMGVIWSLICEAIYYLLYPLILPFLKRINWIIVITFFLSYLLSIYTSLKLLDYNGDFHRNGYLFTWFIGLPVWLLGVKLADNYKYFKTSRALSFIQLNGVRFLVYLISVVCSILRFHAEISYVYSLPLFSILVYFWIKQEVIFYRDKKENKILVFGGLISYSIYLVHALIIYIIEDLTGFDDLRVSLSFCAVAIFSSLLVSYIFYTLIEKPTHTFARQLGSKFK